MKTIAKMLWRGKLMALAVVLALSLAGASTALAANGDFFRLGKSNFASSVSKLIKSGVGPALDLQVSSGPPLSVNSSTKVTNLNADQLDGLDGSAFVKNKPYTIDTPESTGTALPDGTHKQIVSCNSGDLLLSGGAANIDKGTILLESFPDQDGVSWSVRIQNDGTLDSFSAVALCADQ